MKVADLKWFYPKGVQDGDLFTFTVNDNITLPVLTLDESEAKTTFNKGGNVMGTPVASIITNLDGKISRLEGVLVRDFESNGVYIIPKNVVSKQPTPVEKKIETPVETLVKDANELTSGSLEEVKKFDTEKILGFSKRQLLVMALTVFVIIKIAK